MKVELHQKIERTTARRAIKSLLTDSFKILVFDDERITFRYNTDTAAAEVAVFTTDEDQLHVEYQYVAGRGRVLLIYGNDGHDVIVDHTTNLELSLKGASEPTDKIADEDPTTLARVLAEVET